ncbi:expressed unknown protein [Seminavis robusta]|uniref:Transmembrane protein n=1 Tax=Seminavis robusta TaxID=568900 RepID=A0A9N8ETS1_9STRA|nr:expressed unknown protein [Seminavis robusta]|eukprot:Sro1665_g289590.1 n/a (234) ;mRNA; f:11189-11890
MRGGNLKMSSDFTGAASSFFGNTRTAASLVLGTSLGALFALSSFSNSSRTPLEFFMVKAYRLLTWTAFVLSLNCVITCTVASAGILHGNFNPMAETATEFLLREFEYEFVALNWSMLVTLLMFIVLVTTRMLLEFNLLSDPNRSQTAKFVVLSAVALLAHLLSYINSTLCCWSNLWEMTVHMVQVVSSDTLKEPSSMKILSAVAACGSIYYGLSAALTPHTPPAATEQKPKAE